MNRRDAFKSLAAIPMSAALLRWRVPRTAPTALSADGNSPLWSPAALDASVLLDGRDVGLRCTAANEREGWMDRLAEGPDGQCLLTCDGDLAIERIHGDVEIVFSPAFTRTEHRRLIGERVSFLDHWLNV